MTVLGSTALMLALLAGPSRAGAWCAVVGVPTLGAKAAAETGVALRRLALVPAPGAKWAAVVAALVDGVDVIAVRPPCRVGAGEARRLAARARERGAVLMPLGPWEGADLRLSVSGERWTGPEHGAGRLRARRIRVRAQGRGAASRPREATLWLPGPAGLVTSAATPAATSTVTAAATATAAPTAVDPVDSNAPPRLVAV